MSDNLAKFQSLLRELFQFDCADLDFGIYRIMNHKRAVIERWITEDLPNLVRQELQQGTLAAQQKMLEELDTVREEIQKTAENLGEKPFDADGNLLIWQDKPIGKRYIELREKAIHARNSQALEAAFTITSTPSSAATGKRATLSPSAVTPKKNATPSPTTARKCSSTGRTTTSTTSKLANISPITPTKPPTA
jgi:hypothetical protein